METSDTSPSLPKTCPHCDKVVAEDWRRCPYCEQPLSTENATTPPSATTSTERKANGTGKRKIIIRKVAPLQRKTSAKAPPQKAHCPHCSKEVEAEWSFCPYCKNAIKHSPGIHEDTQQQCPFCGHLTSKNARNCPACEATLLRGGYPFLPNAFVWLFVVVFIMFFCWLMNGGGKIPIISDVLDPIFDEDISEAAKEFARKKASSLTSTQKRSVNETINGKPFNVHGGTAPSGDYILTSKEHTLSGTLRVPSGVKMRLDLRGGTLEGSDIVIAEGGELELRNGTVRQPLRNRGTLTLRNLLIGEDISNEEVKLLGLALQLGSIDTLLYNDGIVRGEHIIGINKIKNNGTIDLSGGFYIEIINYAMASLTLQESLVYKLNNREDATTILTGDCKHLYNKGTCTLRGRISDMTNVEGATCTLLNVTLVSGDIVGNKQPQEGLGLYFKVNPEEKGNIQNGGTLIFGQGDFSRGEIELHYFHDFRWHYGVLEGGIAKNNTIKPYNGEPIAFSSNCKTIGTKLVAYAKPGMFVGNLPDGYFAEERPSDKPGLVDLVVVKE